MCGSNSKLALCFGFRAGGPTDHPCMPEPACRFGLTWVPHAVCTPCQSCIECKTQTGGWHMLHVASGARLGTHAACGLGGWFGTRAAHGISPDLSCLLTSGAIQVGPTDTPHTLDPKCRAYLACKLLTGASIHTTQRAGSEFIA